MKQKFPYDSASVGDFLRNVRKERKLSLSSAAAMMNISDRTLRRYESDKVRRPSTTILQKMAEFYEIKLGQLLEEGDLAISNPGEAMRMLALGEESLVQSDFNTARSFGDIIIRGLTSDNNRIVTKDQREAKRILARAYFLAGHAYTVMEKTADPVIGRAYFEKMKSVAQSIKDDTLLCTALTYEGEMLRREGRVLEAIRTIGSAPNGKSVDIDVMGNCAQLLARAYAQMKDEKNVKYYMRSAEDYAFQLAEEHISLSLPIPYNLYSVYEEEARWYMKVGDIDESLKCINLAEKSMPQSPRWTILNGITKGEVLLYTSIKGGRSTSRDIRNNSDFKAGIALLEEALIKAVAYNHQRLLKRVANIRVNFSRMGESCVTVANELGKIQDERIVSSEIGDI